nr:STAS domain-containing protein [Angustibacter aerolatus]
MAAGHHHLIVDMQGVEFLDSTGLGVLVGGLKRVRTHDGTLKPGLLAGARAQGVPDHRSHERLLDPRHGRRGARRAALRHHVLIAR